MFTEIQFTNDETTERFAKYVEDNNLEIERDGFDRFEVYIAITTYFFTSNGEVKVLIDFCDYEHEFECLASDLSEICM